MYFTYKQQLKHFKTRNDYMIERRHRKQKCLSIIKMEMNKRGLKKKKAKR